jgi:3-sulfinopropanoyl-CoA desulfinase
MTLSPEQLDLQKRARRLARETIAPRAAEIDRSEQYPWDNVKALTEAGFFGMTVPRQYGGPGLGFLEAALVVDEMAQVCDASWSKPIWARSRP